MTMYKPTIGIEVHAELKTKTKMFCNCVNQPHGAAPNAHVCPVCMAHPGTLPVINKAAVEHVLTVGVALNADIATYTEFDRKNYFYPDIPKGYQISQYEFPFVKGGELADVAITRVHLEEDTARSLHDQTEGSVVDYNRAGVPLMELVTEPVIHDAKTAGHFARELQLLLRTLGVSDANMERGEMRVEANISISDTDELGAKVEVKNLNSFKAVESAITYEIKRQTKLLEKGDKIIQETRGWDENRAKTFTQRVKESADEYRYFPDPDLPKLDLREIEEFSLSRLKENMEETPDIKRTNYANLGLTREQTDVILVNKALVTFFDRMITDAAFEPVLAKSAANYLTTDVPPLITESRSLTEASHTGFITLLKLLKAGTLNSRIAKDLLEEVLFADIDVHAVAKERGLLQDSSDEALLPVVQAVIAEHTSVVEEFRGGKEASLQFLIGQGMKATKGAANPGILAKLLKEHIEALK